MEEQMSLDLELALFSGPAIRKDNGFLDIGYNVTANTWELIIKYVGDIEKQLADNFGENTFYIKLLLAGYAILLIEEKYIDVLSEISEIIYIEKPNHLEWR